MARGVGMLLVGALASAQVLPQSQLDLQRKAARGLAPAELELRPGRHDKGEPRILKLRVYAARDYREHTFEWSSRFRRIVERVNKAAAAWPGVRFEIGEIRKWERETANARLEDLLSDLEKLDDGGDVDCVIGLVAAVPTFPEQIHNLGMARTPGRHFVMRSLHDLAEYQVVKDAFDQMSAKEKDALMGARKVHKEAVIFLHEWAHTLGIVHAQRWQRIMNPIYDNGQSQFSEVEARMIELALARPPDLRQQFARIARETPDPEWDPRERAWLEGSAPPQVAAPSQVAAPPQRSSAKELLAEAEAQLRAHFDSQAETLLSKAESLAKNKDEWRAAAELRRQLHDPTLAVEDAKKAGADLSQWSLDERRQLLIPANAAELGLPAQKEGEYVRLLMVAMQAAEASPQVAEMMARQLEDSYPRLPAGPYLRCVISLHERAFAPAKKSCEEALARQPDAIPPEEALKRISASAPGSPRR